MLSSPRDLLRATIEFYRKEFWLFLGYTAWLLAPAAAFYFASTLPPGPVTTMLIIAMVVLQLFVWLWILVLLMQATTLLLTNKPIDHNLLCAKSLRRIRPVLGVLFLQALIVLGGFLLLIVPAIIFWTWYALCQVAAGVDDLGPVEALARSRSLVRGRFFTVLWRLISGPIVITLGYGFLLTVILYAIALMLGIDTNMLMSADPPLWENLIDTLVYVFMIPLYIIYMTLLYHDLKSNL